MGKSRKHTFTRIQAATGWKKALGIETLEIDWDSPKDLNRLFFVIQHRLKELTPSFRTVTESQTHHSRRILDACCNLWETDTSSHYAALNLVSEKKYYVYAHLDPTRAIHPNDRLAKLAFGATLGMTHHPFYVGKGTGDRYLDINRNGNHRKVRQRIGEPITMILKDGLSEVEALASEDKLIDIFGLQVFGGYLTNLDEGYHPIERRKLYAEPYAAMLEPARVPKVADVLNLAVASRKAAMAAAA
jgi:hypothetical protein